MTRVARNMDQRAGADYAVFVAQHEMHLPGEDHAELLLVRVFVQRRAFAFGLGDDAKLHELTGNRPGFDLRINLRFLFFQLVQLVKRHTHRQTTG